MCESTLQVFNLIDVGQTGEIDLEMFIKGCVRLSGQAQSRDMLELLVCVSDPTSTYIGS